MLLFGMRKTTTKSEKLGCEEKRCMLIDTCKEERLTQEQQVAASEYTKPLVLDDFSTTVSNVNTKRVHSAKDNLLTVSSWSETAHLNVTGEQVAATVKDIKGELT